MPQQINRNYLLYGLDLKDQKGIEIGPLVSPIVTRELSDVRYVDRASTEDLRKWYSRDEKINVDDIMHIDYIWGEQSLAEATQGTEQFDYCVASHVIEHIPDLITWLQEISSVLKVGGVACFAVPDKRYTFDYLRPLTTAADLVDNHLNKLRKPSYRHIYDHFSNFVDLDITEAWSDDFDGSKLRPAKSAKDTLSACLDSRDNGSYVDSHCSVFTEESFYALLDTVSELGFLDFTVKRHFGVRRGKFEFFVQLEKIDSSLSADEKHVLYAASKFAIESTYFELDFSSTVDCRPKLYYDTGLGYNETETVECAYQNGDTEEGTRRSLRFALPHIDAVKLRFDPSDCEATIRMTDLRHVQNGQSQEIPLDNIEPLSQIASLQQDSGSLVVQTSVEANDPALLIDLQG